MAEYLLLGMPDPIDIGVIHAGPVGQFPDTEAIVFIGLRMRISLVHG